MPTDISNALGTQRQFTPQPDSMYQGRYQGVRAGGAVAADVSREASLAANIERLNAALQGYAVSHERYLNDKGLMLAEDMINPMSEEDIKKLNVTDAAIQEGYVDSLSNPYFRAYAEKLRGGFLSTRAKQEYDEKYSMTPAKSMAEENARYNKFIADWRQDNLQGSSAPTNITAFDKGFNENQIINMANLASDWNKKKHEEDIMVTMASTQSKLGSIIENSVELLKENGAMTKAVQETFNEVRLMGLPPQYRIKLLNDFATQLIQTGHLDATRFEQMMDNVVVQSSMDGSTMTASDLLDMQTFKTYAVDYQRQFMDKWQYDTIDKFAKKGKAGIEEFFKAQAWVQQNDPDKAPIYAQMFPKVVSKVNEYEAEKRAQARAMLSRGKNSNSSQMKLQNTAGAVRAWLGGGMMYNNQPISSLSIDKEALYQVATPILFEFMQNGDVDNASRLMNMPQMGALRSDISADLTYKLDNIRLGADGTVPELDSSVQALLEFSAHNPSTVEHMFGSDVGRRAQILKTLYDLHNGDMSLTLTDFATYNGTDTDTKNGYRQQVSDLVREYAYTAEGVRYLGEEEDNGSTSVSIANNPELESSVTDLATIFCLQGLSPYNALNKAGAVVSNNYMIYHEGVFPKGITSNIADGMSELQSQIYFKRALDDCMYSVTDGYAEYAKVRYDRNTQRFYITDERTGNYGKGRPYYDLGYVRQAALERWNKDMEWFNNGGKEQMETFSQEVNTINAQRQQPSTYDKTVQMVNDLKMKYPTAIW